jgi:hypothetical protein
MSRASVPDQHSEMTQREEGRAAAAPFSGRTAWARNLRTPLREFLRTETGGAVALLAATRLDPLGTPDRA